MTQPAIENATSHNVVPLPPPPPVLRPPVPVVRIGACTKHPNADTLWTTVVFGHVAIFREGQFKEGDLAVAVPVDALVDTKRSSFAFLAAKANKDGKARIKAQRLRGLFSTLVLVGVPDEAPGAIEGDDMAELLGVEKYQSPFDFMEMRGFVASAPKGITVPKYGISLLRENGHLLAEGEPVRLTEKIHGANARLVMTEDGVVHVGSHGAWKKEDAGDGEGGDGIWWPAMRAAGMIDKVRALGPNLVVYGEIYGQVQDLKYGHPDKRTPAYFRAFDIFDAKQGTWADVAELDAIFAAHGIPAVPTLYEGPWRNDLRALAEKDSVLAPHLAEGFVVRTLALRHEPTLHLERSVWKYVGERYQLRKDG